ncbi:MAG: pilV [Herminiimonas sp.]|nr:pilV [Herminiimonas sp.]MDB5855101.1 pilV [Herminiimonas sp.]
MKQGSGSRAATGLGIWQATGARRRHAAGFMMIEVFASIFVLSIGVIGCVALQLAALRTAQQSAMQTAAVHLAADIAEHLRAGATKVAGRELLMQMDYRSQGGKQAAAADTCFQSDCTVQQRAQVDLAELQGKIDRSLPQAHVLICRDGAPWQIHLGAYAWECTDGKSDPLVIKLGWRGAAEALSGTTQNDPPPSLVVAVATPEDLE